PPPWDDDYDPEGLPSPDAGGAATRAAAPSARPAAAVAPAPGDAPAVPAPAVPRTAALATPAPAAAPAPLPSAASAMLTEVPETPSSPLGDRWHALVLQMIERELVAALVRELAMQSECLASEAADGLWRLRVERNTLASDANRGKLEAALAEVLGQPVRLALEVAPTQDTPARREAAKRALRQRQAEEAIQNDPLVVTLMQQFSTARIVPGSIRPV
ncbi:DNA polymerase III subunit gamma/tau, partial [Aquabacterium sp. A7-Y]|uniref:DNA polymerase III subunit gamma/tau C-terminal domain-containing protein n=1 Tax=Aquabacterium sp. A7-Y TaxID=1349605 RepID=UPI002AC7F20C